jgi:hypothetical protein
VCTVALLALSAAGGAEMPTVKLVRMATTDERDAI